MRMKSSPKLRPNGWDGLAAAVVLVLAVACAALVWTGGGQSGPLTAVVSADGETVDQVAIRSLKRFAQIMYFWQRQKAWIRKSLCSDIVSEM